jgi:hypothetical protein
MLILREANFAIDVHGGNGGAAATNTSRGGGGGGGAAGTILVLCRKVVRSSNNTTANMGSINAILSPGQPGAGGTAASTGYGYTGSFYLWSEMCPLNQMVTNWQPVVPL